MKTYTLKLTLLIVSVLFYTKITYSQEEKEDEIHFFYEDSSKLNTFFKDEESFSISFVGNGNIQNTFKNEDDIPVNTGVGVSLNKYLVKEDANGNYTKDYKVLKIFSIYKISLDASINVATTADTLEASFNQNNELTNTSEFGNSILTPLNSGQAVNVDFYAFSNKPILKLFNGIHINYTGSNRIWSLTDTSNMNTYRKASVNKLRVGLFYDFVPMNYNKDYSVYFELAYALNSINGDIGLNKNNSIREFILGSKENTFNGAEFAVGLRLKNVRATFAYTYFPFEDDISGLSGGQLVTTIAFVGGFGLDLDK